MCSEVSVNSAWNLWSQSGRRKGRLRLEGKVQPRVVKVTGLKAASLPRTDCRVAPPNPNLNPIQYVVPWSHASLPCVK